MAQETIKFKIDGEEIVANKGEMILQAAKKSKSSFDIPYYCYHEELPIVAQCRICQVEIKGRPKLATACSTPAEDGMEVFTQTQPVKHARAGVMEMFLLNHPLDCPICDKGGECKLQIYTMRYHKSGSSFGDEKVRRIKHKHMGRVVFDAERCIMCTRCTRFDAEVFGTPQIGVMGRGENLTIDTFDGGDVTHNFSGNFSDLCPVGAWTTTDYRFKARPWELTEIESTCSVCSNGCQSSYWHMNNKIERMISAKHPTINRTWICDKGRGGYHLYNDILHRFKNPIVRRSSETFEEISWIEAIREARGYLQTTDSVEIITTNLITNEGASALSNLASFFKTKINGGEQSQVLKNWKQIVSSGLAQKESAILTTAKRIVIIDEDIWETTPIFAMLLNRRMRNGELNIEKLSSLDQLKASPETLLILGEKTLREKSLTNSLNKLKELGVKEILPLFDGKWGSNPRGLLNSNIAPFGKEVEEEALKNTKVALIMGANTTFDKGLSQEFLNQLSKLERLILLDHVTSPIAEIADLILPINSFVMSSGTTTIFDNQKQNVIQILQSTENLRSIEEIASDLTSHYYEEDKKEDLRS